MSEREAALLPDMLLAARRARVCRRARRGGLSRKRRYVASSPVGTRPSTAPLASAVAISGSRRKSSIARFGNSLAIGTRVLAPQAHRLGGIAQGVLDSAAGRPAARQVGNDHAKRAAFAINQCDIAGPFSAPILRPWQSRGPRPESKVGWRGTIIRMLSRLRDLTRLAVVIPRGFRPCGKDACYEPVD